MYYLNVELLRADTSMSRVNEAEVPVNSFPAIDNFEYERQQTYYTSTL